MNLSMDWRQPIVLSKTEHAETGPTVCAVGETGTSYTKEKRPGQLVTSVALCCLGNLPVTVIQGLGGPIHSSLTQDA